MNWNTIWSKDNKSSIELQHVTAKENAKPGELQNEAYRLITNKGSTGAVCIVKDENKYAFVKQFRASIGEWTLELPRGGGELSDESSINTGKREVLEEIGYETKNAEKVSTIWADTGLLGNPIDIICMEIAEKNSDHIDNEIKEVIWLQKDEIEKFIYTSKINDGISISALTLYFNLI